MIAVALLLVLALATPAPSAPQEPWAPHVLVVPTLACEVDLPAGWTSGRPMPDHVFEIWRTTAEGPRPALTAEEAPPATTQAEAEQALVARMSRVWGPTRVRFDGREPIAGGALLRFHLSDPDDEVRTGVFLVNGKVLLVHVDPAVTDAARTALTTLRCHAANP